MKNLKRRLSSRRGNALIFVIAMLIVCFFILGTALSAMVATTKMTRIDRNMSEAHFIAQSAAELVRVEIIDILRQYDKIQQNIENLDTSIKNTTQSADSDWYIMSTQRMELYQNQAETLAAVIKERILPDIDESFTHTVTFEGHLVPVIIQRLSDMIVLSARAEIKGGTGLAELSIGIEAKATTYNYSYVNDYQKNPFNYAIISQGSVESFAVYGGIHAKGDVLTYGHSLSGTIRSGGLVSTDVTGRTNDSSGAGVGAEIRGDVISANGLYTGRVIGNIFSGNEIAVGYCTGTVYGKPNTNFNYYLKETIEKQDPNDVNSPDVTNTVIENTSHILMAGEAVNIGGIPVITIPTTETYRSAANVKKIENGLLTTLIGNMISKNFSHGAQYVPGGVTHIGETPGLRYIYLNDGFFRNGDTIYVYGDDTVYFYTEASTLTDDELHTGEIVRGDGGKAQIVVLAPNLSGKLKLNGWNLSNVDLYLYAPDLELINASGRGLDITGSLFVKKFSGGESNYHASIPAVGADPYMSCGTDVTFIELNDTLKADLDYDQPHGTTQSVAIALTTYIVGDTLWRRPGR